MTDKIPDASELSALDTLALETLALETLVRYFVVTYLQRRVDPNHMIDIRLPGSINVLRMRAQDLIPYVLRALPKM